MLAATVGHAPHSAGGGSFRVPAVGEELLGLGDDLFDVAGGGGGGEGSGAEVVHDVQVVVQVRGRLQVEGAGEVLDVDHVGQGGFGEAQDGERAARRGVAAVAERHNLQADLGQGGDLNQVLQLGAYHLAAAHGPAQRCFVHDRPHPGRVGGGEQVLAFHAQADPAVDLPGGRALVAEHRDRAGIVLGLEQAVHELELEGANDRRGRL